MENLQTNEKYNFLKKFKFYALLGVLTVTTSLGALVSCGKKKHPTPSTPHSSVITPSLSENSFMDFDQLRFPSTSRCLWMMTCDPTFRGP